MAMALAKPPPLTAWDGDFDTEDAKFMLRSLEHDAYGVVVSAFRAQGPLTTYKAALLEHLRAALFVPVSRHKAELCRAVNDPLLATVARRMNPLADVYADWASEAAPVLNPVPNAPLSSSLGRGASAAAAQADRLAAAARAHNRAVADVPDDHFFRHLQDTPRAPYVPEALRFMLKATAESVTKIPSPVKVERASSSTLPQPPGPSAHRLSSLKGLKGLKRKPGKRQLNHALKFEVALAAKNGTEEGGAEDAVRSFVLDDNTDNSSEDPSSRSETPSSLASTSEPWRKAGRRVEPPAPSDSAAGTRCAKVLTTQPPTPPRAKLLPNSAHGHHPAKLPSPGKESSSRCARCEPFVFPRAAGGCAKPPRGNPDRRVRKHPSVAPTLGPSAPPRHLTAIRGPQPTAMGSQAMRTGLRPGGSWSAEPTHHTDQEYLYSCLPRREQQVRRYPAPLVGTTAASPSPGGAEYFGSYFVRGRVPPPPVPQAPPQRLVQPPPPTPSAAVQAAYSSPTRPYYGNPSAAAVGIKNPAETLGPGLRAVVSTAPVSLPSLGLGEKVLLLRHPQPPAHIPAAPTRPHLGPPPGLPQPQPNQEPVGGTTTLVSVGPSSGVPPPASLANHVRPSPPPAALPALAASPQPLLTQPLLPLSPPAPHCSLGPVAEPTPMEQN